MGAGLHVRGLKGAGGYSLAELLIAVSIFSITIIALVGVLRKGSEISTTDGHRKRARALIDSCFESASYQPANYANLAAVSRAVLVDPRGNGTADDLAGTLRITVTPGTDNSSGTAIPFTRVTISVTWPEPEGSQAISLEKVLTNL